MLISTAGGRSRKETTSPFDFLDFDFVWPANKIFRLSLTVIELIKVISLAEKWASGLKKGLLNEVSKNAATKGTSLDHIASFNQTVRAIRSSRLIYRAN
jgi:hypothetical protein